MYLTSQLLYHIILYGNIIHICSGMTSGRVLNWELLYTKILEVNLFAFANRLFHEDFSSIIGAFCKRMQKNAKRMQKAPMIEEKSS